MIHYKKTYDAYRTLSATSKCKGLSKAKGFITDGEENARGANASLSFSKTTARKSSGISVFAIKRNSVSSCIKFLEFQESGKVYWMLFIRMIYVVVWSHQRGRCKMC